MVKSLVRSRTRRASPFFWLLLAILLVSGCVVLGMTTIPSVSLAHVSGSDTSSTALGQSGGQPSWLVKPQFANKVLHWGQTATSYTVDSTGTLQGQTLTGDIWMKVGSDGLPILTHVRYTQPDGALAQEIVQTRTTETDFFGVGYPSSRCQTSPHTASVQDLRAALPSFVNTAQFPAAGYQQVSVSNQHAIPATTRLPGIQPVQTYALTTIVQSWQLQGVFSSQMKDTLIVSFGKDQRVLMQEVQLFDSHGKMIQKNWHTYGPLQVYTLTTVPANVFNFAGQKPGSCN